MSRWEPYPVEPAPPEVQPERKFSVFRRIVGVLFSPADTMEDIADAPDYLGVIAIILMLVVLSGIGYWVVLQKFVFVGEYAGLVSGFLGVVLSGAFVVAGFLFVGVWLVESLIVKYGCDSGSGWSFKTAASVAGYAWVISVFWCLFLFRIFCFPRSRLTRRVCLIRCRVLRV